MPEMGQVCKPMASSAWIEPDGKFHYVPDCNHSAIAEDVFHTTSYMLERMGWVHLSWASVYYDRRVTSSQMNTIWDTLAAWEESTEDRAPRIAADLRYWLLHRDDNSEF
jgi:hypothetical protein